MAGTLGACAAPPAAPPPASLGCRLEVPARVPPGGPVTVTLTLTNLGKQPLAVLVWGTPFEPTWFAPWLTVAREGVAVPYGGAKVKRGDPRAEHYLHLAAGQAREASIDLSPVFDLTVPGDYRLQPQIVLHDVVAAGLGTAPRPRDQHVSMPLACGAVGFTVAR